ncbi:acyltransferase domain-containing protein [Nocardia sp. NPDC023852]|uniref:acyltransferase domain-containing protein n=1 Tax=Nocardia sp. NPDC023852 TaxID=3154697 RepID=UPI0033F448F8
MTEQPITLLLPGQGSQHTGMALDAYRHQPEFAATIDEFLALMSEEGVEPKQRWLSDDPQADLDDGRVAQPLIFAVEYAFATMLIRAGANVEALLGHSVGELAAATVAGVFDAHSAARIMAARSRALDLVPPGGMFAVAADPAVVSAQLRAEWARAGVVVAAVNGPRRAIVAGPDPEVQTAESMLCERGFVTMSVPARQPWHSPCMAHAATVFERSIAAERLHEPKIPIWSGRTGQRLRADEAKDPGFWAAQIAHPVLFWDALSDLLAHRSSLLIETGPGTGLSVQAMSHPEVREGRSKIVPITQGPGQREQSSAPIG